MFTAPLWSFLGDVCIPDSESPRYCKCVNRTISNFFLTIVIPHGFSFSPRHCWRTFQQKTQRVSGGCSELMPGSTHATQATALTGHQHNRNSFELSTNCWKHTTGKTPQHTHKLNKSPARNQHTSITVKHIQDQHFQQTAKHSNPTKNPFQTSRRYSIIIAKVPYQILSKNWSLFFLVMTNIINKRSSWLVLIRVGRE